MRFLLKLNGFWISIIILYIYGPTVFCQLYIASMLAMWLFHIRIENLPETGKSIKKIAAPYKWDDIFYGLISIFAFVIVIIINYIYPEVE